MGCLSFYNSCRGFEHLIFDIQVLTRGKELGCQGATRLSEPVIESLGVDSEVFSGNMDNYPTNLLSLASCSFASDTSGPTVLHSPRPVKAGVGRTASFQEASEMMPPASCPLQHHSHPPLLGQLPRSSEVKPEASQELANKRRGRGRKPARAASVPDGQPPSPCLVKLS